MGTGTCRWGVRHARRLLAVALMLTTSMAFSACGGSNSSVNPDGPETTTTSLDVAPPSIPAGDTEACVLFAETVGLMGLVPKDSPSWRDERERILVDARRDADLLRRVSATVPADLVVSFDTVANYAEFVADAMDASSDYEDALERLDAFGDLSEVRTQDAAIDDWHDSTC